MRLIDGDKLKEYIDAQKGRPFIGCTIGEALKIMTDEQPTVDAIPVVHGRWIYGENDGQDGWYCSECGGFVPWDYDYYGLDNIDFIKDFKTCPRCGTRMISYTGMEEGEQDG